MAVLCMCNENMQNEHHLRPNLLNCHVLQEIGVKKQLGDVKITDCCIITDYDCNLIVDLAVGQMPPLHSTPLTGRAITPQRQGHIGGPIAQP